MSASLRLPYTLRLGKRSLSLARAKIYKDNNCYALCRKNFSTLYSQRRLLSLEATSAKPVDTDDHGIIKNTEKATGETVKHEFQSETRMLLNIVAKSLYSDKEVFIRELISNASDALEKLRYLRLSENLSMDEGGDRNLEIHIATNKQDRLLIIQDTGIGLTKDDLISNLGTIARSGSKTFLEQLEKKQNPSDASKIIGQFGVGFYSAFMVADKVEVFTKSYKNNSEGLYWVSDGSGSYEIANAEGVQPGTKIVLHLRNDCREFSDDANVNGIIQKYSNFVGSPIFLNGKRANTIEAIWMLDPKDVTPEQHLQFYRFIGNCYDEQRFTLHYTTDAPVSIRALLYFPEGKPGLFEATRDGTPGVALYSRKVLIQNKAENILPKFLRFIKGVVDSEDIPLNLSRELLQNSALITKLRNVLTTRIIRFLQDQAKKQPEEFLKFYNHYNAFFKEGIITTPDDTGKEEISKLLRFESSIKKAGEITSLPEYCERFAKDQKYIYYLAAPSRILAEQSPYFESFKNSNLEVLFCLDPYDELVLMNLKRFKAFDIISVEKDMHQTADTKEKDTSVLFNEQEINDVISYMKTILKNKAHEIKTTNRLEFHPCVVTVQDMASARHFIRTQSHQFDDNLRYSLLQPRLEINPNHPLIKHLIKLKSSDEEIASLLTQQLFMNAMVTAGLIEDTCSSLITMNQLITLILEKKTK
ncbi:PREDICTED: heat shock protein 75 kDa, mitochondrial [Ceratosolen solmsi marchali]|uniref:Heat shock protein 75 kDa, mitochondrial n=1 Tax=Ceratosolen solmsi marchali TaxID=326594 RepID=A0AAJ7DYU8_9HYME|nr:PREDICTED: heat shock protein 75 kDa, mitochondrial [Ceratosolen solmsi marchali]